MHFPPERHVEKQKAESREQRSEVRDCCGRDGGQADAPLRWGVNAADVFNHSGRGETCCRPVAFRVGFLAVFGGIELVCLSSCQKTLLSILKGLNLPAHGLPRLRDGLPWAAACRLHNPEGVEYEIFMQMGSTLSGLYSLAFLPQDSSCLASLG